MTYYQKAIAQYLDKHKISGFDPRHIEAFMLLQYSTLSHLDARTFNKEIRIGIECIKEGGKDAAEKHARDLLSRLGAA